MTPLVPELARLPVRGVFDGELIALADGLPHFPLVCDRMLHRDTTVPLTYVIFDVLELDGEPTIARPYRERRALLDGLSLGGGRGSLPSRSMTAPPCSPPSATGDSKVLSPNAAASGIGPVNVPGSKRRTATTGVTVRRWNRCGAVLFAPRRWGNQQANLGGGRRCRSTATSTFCPPRRDGVLSWRALADRK
jgi:hypothetical protein